MSIDEIEQRSFEFIEQHLDATFDEVPEYLFKIWHIPVPLKDYLSVNYKDKYEYRIFLYALRKYCKTYKSVTSPKNAHCFLGLSRKTAKPKIHSTAM